jgi:putative ABC transport system substrate-binding protein
MQFDQLKRREFLTLLGGGAVAWPLAARAQQGERMRRIGVLMGLAARDAEALLRVRAFESTWRELGWVEGRNIRVDYRWAPGDASVFRARAGELVASAPDVILAGGTPILAAVRNATQTIPIVFVGVSDPDGTGVVASLSRPGGNITGFANFEPPIGGKWVQALREVSPNVTRVAVLRNPDALARFMQAIEIMAPSFGIEAFECRARDTSEIERAIDALASQPNVGLIILPDPVFTASRRSIIELAARHRIPAVYPFRFFADDGGLLSYGVDVPDQLRRAAYYIDRILKGEKAANLPVQAPTKFELVINLKTARALGLTVPDTLLARADEVIE